MECGPIGKRCSCETPDPSTEGHIINGSIPLGRFAGISVAAHWSAGLITAVLLGTLHGLFGLHAAVVGTIAFLISILLHEFGHALTARHFGVGGSRESLATPPRAQSWIDSVSTPKWRAVSA